LYLFLLTGRGGDEAEGVGVCVGVGVEIGVWVWVGEVTEILISIGERCRGGGVEDDSVVSEMGVVGCGVLCDNLMNSFDSISLSFEIFCEGESKLSDFICKPSVISLMTIWKSFVCSVDGSGEKSVVSDCVALLLREVAEGEDGNVRWLGDDGCEERGEEGCEERGDCEEIAGDGLGSRVRGEDGGPRSGEAPHGKAVSNEFKSQSSLVSPPSLSSGCAIPLTCCIHVSKALR
jgi:hypothetical protein